MLVVERMTDASPLYDLQVQLGKPCIVQDKFYLPERNDID